MTGWKPVPQLSAAPQSLGLSVPWPLSPLVPQSLGPSVLWSDLPRPLHGQRAAAPQSLGPSVLWSLSPLAPRGPPVSWFPRRRDAYSYSVCEALRLAAESGWAARGPGGRTERQAPEGHSTTAPTAYAAFRRGRSHALRGAQKRPHPAAGRGGVSDPGGNRPTNARFIAGPGLSGRGLPRATGSCHEFWSQPTARRIHQAIDKRWNPV